MAQMALEFNANVQGKKTEIINAGNVDLKLWGYKLSGEPAKFYKNPISLRRGEHANPPTLLKDILNAKGNGVISLDIYVRDDFGNEFIGNTNWAGPLGGMFTTLNLMQSRWASPK
jgi:hypothetical protein